MSKTPRERGENPSNDDFNELLNEDEVGGEAYGGFLVPTERDIDPNIMQRLVLQTIGSEDVYCDMCDDFCAHSMLKSRDIILTKALILSEELQKHLKLYQKLRKLNVTECHDLLSKMYKIWRDSTYLYEIAEFHSGFNDEDDDNDGEEFEIVDED